MDKIILVYLFSLFGLLAKGNAQLHCFECSNCPNVNELDTNMIQVCDLQDPDITTTDPDITTTDPDITTIETEVTTTSTTTTTSGITTQTAPTEIPSTTSQMPTSSDDTTISTTDDGPPTQTTPPVPPTTTSQTPGPPPVQLQVGGNQCYVIHRRVGDAVQVNRGCAITRANDTETCIAANLGEPYEYCHLCAHDECNIASKYVISLTVVISSLFIALNIN